MNIYRIQAGGTNVGSIDVTVRAGNPAVAIKRAVDGIYPAKSKGLWVRAEYVGSVKYEYRVRADVRNEQGGWTRTWLTAGPFKTRQDAQQAIRIIEAEPEQYRYMRPDRVEVGRVK